MTQSQQIDALKELLDTVEWPETALKYQFWREVEPIWNEGGIDTVSRWVSVLGKPSQFLGHKLWAADQCRMHFIQLTKYEEAEKIKEAESKKDKLPNAERKEAIALASKNWHDAIAMRKEKIDASKEWSRLECDRIKEMHRVTEMQWNSYVEALRETVRNLRGY